jgi:hypothetical protein
MGIGFIYELRKIGWKLKGQQRLHKIFLPFWAKSNPIQITFSSSTKIHTNIIVPYNFLLIKNIHLKYWTLSYFSYNFNIKIRRNKADTLIVVKNRFV